MIVNYQFRVLFMDTRFIEEVLDFKKVHAHVGHLLEEGFLTFGEEVRAFLITTKTSLSR